MLNNEIVTFELLFVHNHKSRYQFACQDLNYICYKWWKLVKAFLIVFYMGYNHLNIMKSFEILEIGLKMYKI